MGAGASIGSYQTAIDQCVSVLKDKDQIKELWSDIDFNGNGYVSLAEIDRVNFLRTCREPFCSRIKKYCNKTHMTHPHTL